MLPAAAVEDVIVAQRGHIVISRTPHFRRFASAAMVYVVRSYAVRSTFLVTAIRFLFCT